jgi:hypothetical protein
MLRIVNAQQITTVQRITIVLGEINKLPMD